MTEIVEEVPLADGGRILIYDDGSQQWLRGTTVVYGEGPMTPDRGVDRTADGATGSRDLVAALRGTPRRDTVDTSNPADLQWLRDQITSGNITRESRPLRSVAPDEYFILLDHEGWGYQIGRRTSITFAQQIIGRMAGNAVYNHEKYLWGARGSSAARAAWRRDFARTHPVSALVLSDESETAIADTGIPAESADVFRGSFNPADLPRVLMDISRAAMQADEQIASHFQQFVAQYNDDGVAGSIVAILAGVVEFVVRFVVSIVALPAALATLWDEAGNILQSIQEALPDILQALQEAPLETSQYLSGIALDALSDLTGISGIRDELVSGVEVAGEGRDAESSLHIIRATTRILELITIVRGLVTGLRRLPAIARRLRTQLQRINQLLPRLRAMRTALREGRGATAALDDAGEASSRARSSGSRGDHTPDAPETANSPETPEPSRPRSEADELADELGIDDAIAEDAPYGERESVSGRREAGRVRMRREDGSSTRLDLERRALHRLQTQILTRAQIRAAARFVGQRLNSQLRQLWRSILTRTDHADLAEIRRLLRRAETETSAAAQRAMREGAYGIARTRLYPRVATRFWTAIHDRPRFAHIFESAGLRLRRGRVPAWILPDGTEVRLSLEHLARVSDDPLRCIDPANLSIVPLAENSDLLETIRAMSHFADFAGGG